MAQINYWKNWEINNYGRIPKNQTRYREKKSREIVIHNLEYNDILIFLYGTRPSRVKIKIKINRRTSWTVCQC